MPTRVEERGEDAPRRGKHAIHAKQGTGEVRFDDGVDDVTFAPSVFEDDGGAHARSSDTQEVPAYLRKSKKMRRALIIAIIALVALIVAGSVVAGMFFLESQTVASEQAQNTVQEVSEMGGQTEAQDAGTKAEKTTTVPNLVELLGKTPDEAVELLERGAQVTSTKDIDEEGNPIKNETRIALTAEPTNSRSGSPTVYLGLNGEGRAIQVGYSVATGFLGYGSLSFADAVKNEHVIERTLSEAGVEVAAGAVALPEDKAAYSSYAEDGATLTREYCSFSGEVELAGEPHLWSAVLSYDYAPANVTGNIADTIRTVFVYVNAPVAPEEDAAE